MYFFNLGIRKTSYTTLKREKIVAFLDKLGIFSTDVGALSRFSLLVFRLRIVQIV